MIDCSPHATPYCQDNGAGRAQPSNAHERRHQPVRASNAVVRSIIGRKNNVYCVIGCDTRESQHLEGLSRLSLDAPPKALIKLGQIASRRATALPSGL
jgi:hypothetical protein